jgi:hypothetical protein
MLAVLLPNQSFKKGRLQVVCQSIRQCGFITSLSTNATLWLDKVLRTLPVIKALRLFTTGYRSVPRLQKYKYNRHRIYKSIDPFEKSA